MSKIDTKGAIAALGKIKETVQALQDRYAALEAERKALTLRNHDLYMSPLRHDDVKALMLKFVDQKARAYLDSGAARSAFLTFCSPSAGSERLVHNGETGTLAVSRGSGSLNLADAENMSSALINLERTIGVSEFDLFPAQAAATDSSARFYFFFGDLIKKKVELLFSSLTDGARTGGDQALPIEQRKQEIEANTEKVQEIEAEITAIVEQLHGLGVASARLPSGMSQINRFR